MEPNEIQKLGTEIAKISNPGMKLLAALLAPWDARRNTEAETQAKVQNALAEHYSFNDEELDFIINYDTKFRKGREVR